jgi:hypothetical protein
VQVRIPHPDLQRQPDYAFFKSAQERAAAQPRIGAPHYWRDVTCLGDAKKWTASLDKERAADENPTAQICNYLYRARVRWGILTNGRVWRLYERERSSAGGIYYEVDLENQLRLGDREAFKRLFPLRRRRRPSSVFGPDMLHGADGGLRSERIETVAPGLAKKVYRFQIRNDDGRQYFCLISRGHPALCFVLVYFDPDNEPSGTYFIRRGRARRYDVPAHLQEALMAKHGITGEVFDAEWSAEDESSYWEASWELMDLAEAHWERTLLKAIRR